MNWKFLGPAFVARLGPRSLLIAGDEYLPPYHHRIGLLVIVDDMTVEPEFNELAPSGVAIHVARMVYDPTSISPKTLLTLESQVEKATRELIWVRPNVVCFACTSASLVIGDENILSRIRMVIPAVPATTTITAVIAAMHELGMKRIAVGTPYTEDVNLAERKYLEERGFEIVNMEGLGIREGPLLSLQEVETVYSLAMRVDKREADGVFLSCTGLHAIPVIDTLERELGKPVISSNQAGFWHSCKLGGIVGPIEGFGSLLRRL